MITLSMNNIHTEKVITSVIAELSQKLTREEEAALIQYAILVANTFLSSDIDEDALTAIKDASNSLKSKNIVKIINGVNSLNEAAYTKSIDSDVTIDGDAQSIFIGQRELDI